MARKYVTDDGTVYASLSELMGEGHVIRVHADGTITEPRDVQAPEVYWCGGTHHVDQVPGDMWSLMNGYSGQQGYAGPVMHASEFIGGAMELDIIETPGYYIFLAVEDISECDSHCKEDCDGEHEPAGWVVAQWETED